MRTLTPAALLASALLTCAFAAEPCVSGLSAGARPGPYSFILSTGVNRGQAQCFICETADRPAVVVFARSPGDALGKLAGKLDTAVALHKAAELKGWITFLTDDQTTLDPQLVRWSQQHGLKTLPVGAFEDAGGPPGYRLARDADVTVILFVKRKVVANFAFRAGELTDEAANQVLDAVPKILEKK